MEIYSFGRKNPRNPFNGGFVKEDIQGNLFKQARCSVYCCTVTDDELRKMNDYINRMEAQKALYRYNLIGLFAVAFNRPLRRRNAFFCSQFVATVLLECGIAAFDRPLSLITPYDLQESPSFALVYQGKLADFCTETEMEMMHANEKVQSLGGGGLILFKLVVHFRSQSSYAFHHKMAYWRNTRSDIRKLPFLFQIDFPLHRPLQM